MFRVSVPNDWFFLCIINVVGFKVAAENYIVVLNAVRGKWQFRGISHLNKQRIIPHHGKFWDKTEPRSSTKFYLQDHLFHKVKNKLAYGFSGHLFGRVS